MGLFPGLLTAPSWQSFSLLACGWALATDRHTITTYLWLTGASTVKHFSRFYVFLGGPLYTRRWQLWGAVIRLAARFVPEGEVIRVSFDDTTKKKSGTHIEGLDRYRNAKGSRGTAEIRLEMQKIMQLDAAVFRTGATLADGGQVQMPLAQTFFSPRFGMVADRFGISWMVYVAPAEPVS